MQELKLYEISEAMQQVIYECDEDWCIDSEKLDAIQMQFDDKAMATVQVVDKMSDEIDLLASKIKEYQAMKKQRENAVKSIKEYLKVNMLKTNTKEIVRGLRKICFSKSQSVEIEDIEKIPAKFKTIEVTADKTAIKAAIKAWEKIEWASLKDNENLQIK